MIPFIVRVILRSILFSMIISQHTVQKILLWAVCSACTSTLILDKDISLWAFCVPGTVIICWNSLFQFSDLHWPLWKVLPVSIAGAHYMAIYRCPSKLVVRRHHWICPQTLKIELKIYVIHQYLLSYCTFSLHSIIEFRKAFWFGLPLVSLISHLFLL